MINRSRQRRQKLKARKFKQANSSALNMRELCTKTESASLTEKTVA